MVDSPYAQVLHKDKINCAVGALWDGEVGYKWGIPLFCAPPVHTLPENTTPVLGSRLDNTAFLNWGVIGLFIQEIF